MISVIIFIPKEHRKLVGYTDFLLDAEREIQTRTGHPAHVSTVVCDNQGSAVICVPVSVLYDQSLGIKEEEIVETTRTALVIAWRQRLTVAAKKRLGYFLISAKAARRVDSDPPWG